MEGWYQKHSSEPRTERIEISFYLPKYEARENAYTAVHKFHHPHMFFGYRIEPDLTFLLNLNRHYKFTHIIDCV